ncbi:helix-turn-helix domain-containing protein [Amnibacterium sp. CER49]|uniref:helix-turn-helix domain-containing protein n=1 Tax=Amnibacterium sp. CER49 TaxID=3039161 RepID=UPI002448B67C|nr:helix-turn-helix domain-containing protein [Amnibacterium sp. CER49]MDH2442513.1 helix-turn-helix domain-containing protein [Amnibacterium sp. CER49]
MAGEQHSEARQVGVEALKALAHPLRVRLFSALSSYGPATASALAARLGESSGSTSYHLRQLERHGFVREDVSRGNARDRWWERVPGPIELESASEAAGPAGALIEAEFQKVENERLADYLRARDEQPEEWRRATQISSATLRLSADELLELGERFDLLIDRYRGRPDDGRGRRRIDVHFRAFPVVDPGPSRSQEPRTDPESPEGAQP